MNYADTNWLTAVYLSPRDAEGRRREKIVERFTRQHGPRLVLSHVTLLECRNVFRRITQEAQPEELAQMEADFNERLFVDTMNWDLLRREADAMFERHSPAAEVGTFDCAIIASAKLAGATRFLSFDARARALAVKEGLAIFPAR